MYKPLYEGPFEFLNKDLSSLPSHLTILYYKKRADFIVKCIESIYDNYKGYFSMNEINYINSKLQEARSLDHRINQILELPQCNVEKKEKKYNYHTHEEYIDVWTEYEVLANERYELKEKLEEIFGIENSLIKYNQRIWHNETLNGNVILFQTRPIHDDNPEKKGFISSTAVLTNPKDKSWNTTYKDANYGFGYIIGRDEKIIAGGQGDINSGDSGAYEISNETFDGDNGISVYAEFNSGVSKLCTPILAMQKTYNIYGEPCIGYNEIVISYKKPDYMIFSGGFKNYANCKLAAIENYCAGIPTKRIPLNINQNPEKNDSTLLSEKELLLLDEPFQKRLSYLGIDIQKFIDEAYDEYMNIRQDEYKNAGLTKSL